MKRLLAFLLSVTMGLSLIGGTVFASESDKTILNEFIDDYCSVTNLTKAEANDNYEELLAIDDSDLIKFIKSTHSALNNNDVYGSILYIQDNYDKIVAELSDDEKHQIDLYLMKLALNYYLENYNPVTETNEEVTLNAPNVSVEDSLISDIAIPESSSSGTTVAKLVLFSDPSTNVYTKELFSGINVEYDTGVHSWIVVRNVSNENIVVGKMTIAPSTEISVGTWGNKSEHIGAWYNLEPYMIKYSKGYTGRVSTTCNLTASKLATLSEFIRNNDKWSLTNNCAAFAEDAWNKVASSSISAGIIKTPKTLGENIKKKTYKTAEGTRYFYTVHYAQGTGTPKESTIYTRTD